MCKNLVRPFLMVAVLIFIAATLAAQSGDAVPGGAGCPNRGVKWVPPQWGGSDAGTSCNSGIGFTFQGGAYTADAQLCPSQVEYVPGHFESDPATFKHCTYWYPKGTYQMKISKYSCLGPLAGCGLLGLGWCCKEDSTTDWPEFTNYAEGLCQPCGGSQ